MRKPNLLAMCAVSLGLIVWTSSWVLGHGHERGDAKATISGVKVSINYGRPSLNNRDVMKLIQPGKLWRIGADDPTTIESDADLDFGGTRVPKGMHILLARYIEPGKWALVVSRKDVFHYEPSAKLAEVPMQLQDGQDPADDVTIQLSSKSGRGLITIAWGTLQLQTSFSPAR
jgi:hypothetical protein